MAVWAEWTAPRVRTATGWMLGSLVAGTLLAWLTGQLAFVDFADSQTTSPLGPLCLLGGALAYLAGPFAIARQRGQWRYLALVGLSLVPLAAVAAVLVAQVR